ncbi:para-aminobenzoate synthase aminase component [Vibrio ponticus]|nr:para-aminobenzoate synthase aminase component [Vibrio ponticus]
MSQFKQMNNTQPNRLQINQIEYSNQLAQTLFAPIATQNWAMLLRSASQQHVDSRFDILVANPLVTLVTHGDDTHVCSGNDNYHSQQDPFQLIEQELASQLGTLDYQGELPFIGGALGYFAYDLGRRVETLPSLAEHDLTSQIWLLASTNGR